MMKKILVTLGLVCSLFCGAQGQKGPVNQCSPMKNGKICYMDADNLEQAFREFTAKTLTKEQRPSIRRVLAAAKQKAAQQPKRAKEKIKQRGLER